MAQKLEPCAIMRQTSRRQADHQSEKLVITALPAVWLIARDWSSLYATLQGLAVLSAQLFVCLHLVSMQPGAGVFE